MVRALIATVRALAGDRRTQIYEAAGALSLVVGAAMWAPAAGWVVVGVALLGKSLEHDLGRSRDG